jgi:threonine synthase
MSQVVYYVAACRALSGPLTFCVPTGNFGNVLSGWIARTMGAPIAGFIVASNTNDILTRFFKDNDMSAVPVVPTLSPSMDIQVSSNFERLLFEMNGRDGGLTTEQLQRFRVTGRLRVEDDQRRDFLDGTFVAERVDDDGTLDVIARTYRDVELLVDPHTAVAVGAAQKVAAAGGVPGQLVTLATAHPAKFPDAVEKATGVRPELPPHLDDLFDRPERLVELPNDLSLVQRFVSGG